MIDSGRSDGVSKPIMFEAQEDPLPPMSALTPEAPNTVATSAIVCRISFPRPRYQHHGLLLVLMQFDGEASGTSHNDNDALRPVGFVWVSTTSAFDGTSFRRVALEPADIVGGVGCKLACFGVGIDFRSGGWTSRVLAIGEGTWPILSRTTRKWSFIVVSDPDSRATTTESVTVQVIEIGSRGCSTLADVRGVERRGYGCTAHKRSALDVIRRLGKLTKQQ